MVGGADEIGFGAFCGRGGQEGDLVFEDLEEGIQLHGKICCEVVVGFEEIVTTGAECCRRVEKGGNNEWHHYGHVSCLSARILIHNISPCVYNACYFFIIRIL